MVTRRRLLWAAMLPLATLAVSASVQAGPKKGAPPAKGGKGGAVPGGNKAALGAAMVQAAIQGDMARAQALLAKGADPNARNPQGVTALFAGASRSQGTALVKQLLARGARPDVPDAQGHRAIIAASGTGNKAVVQMLLDKGAAVNGAGQDGMTALIAASIKGDPQIVKMLLDKGADASAKTAEGQTALTLAQSFVTAGDNSPDRLEVIKLLQQPAGPQDAH